MLEALQLALQAIPLSNPNPRVGCVLVSNNQVIGRGFTQAPGNHHAEIMALLDAQSYGAPIEGATAYVTLEPCCHFGKTPPCTLALIEAKISRVVIATLDPNPLVSGKGVEELRSAGIKVESGLLEQEAIMQNLGFRKRMQEGMPWVRLKIAASLDAITSLPNGQSQWITGESARIDGHFWRSQASILVSGSGTVMADDPQLNVRHFPVQEQPLRVIVDSHLAIDLNVQVLRNGKTSIFYADPIDASIPDKIAALKDLGVSVISMPNSRGKVDLPLMFEYLAKEYSANEVHVEAGSRLNGSMIKENCVDELLMYYAPCLLGIGAGIANVGPLDSLQDRSSWKFIDQQMIGSDLRLRLFRETSFA